MWLSKQDNRGNDVNLHLENIYLDELQEDGLLLYERIKVLLSNMLSYVVEFLIDAGWAWLGAEFELN